MYFHKIILRVKVHIWRDELAFNWFSINEQI
jgi:hypothetical protein